MAANNIRTVIEKKINRAVQKERINTRIKVLEDIHGFTETANGKVPTLKTKLIRFYYNKDCCLPFPQRIQLISKCCRNSGKLLRVLNKMHKQTRINKYFSCKLICFIRLFSFTYSLIHTLTALLFEQNNSQL